MKFESKCLNYPDLRRCSDILDQQNLFFKENCSDCLFQFLCFDDFNLPEHCLISDTLDYVSRKEVDKK